jgi:hypothetical protein
MTLNDIKKELYKQKPTAYLKYIRKETAFYSASVSGYNIEFEIPVNDMGEADFGPTMDGKLLIRWISSFAKDDLLEFFSKTLNDVFNDTFPENE